MKSYSMDLRTRVLDACDEGDQTLLQIAKRFQVSLAWISKMKKQRRDLGTLEPQTHTCGRKPKLTKQKLNLLAKWVARKPDLTLKQLRDKINVSCCLQTIQNGLNKLGITYKKNETGSRTRTA